MDLENLLRAHGKIHQGGEQRGELTMQCYFPAAHELMDELK